MSKLSRLVVLICGFLFVYGPAFTQEKTVAGLYNEGLALLKTKDYVGGLALMEEAHANAGEGDEKVIELAKKNGSIAAYNAGNAERKKKAFNAAIELYNRGILLNPENSSNYEGVARAQEDKGDNVAAVKAYLEAAAKGRAEGKPDRAAKRRKKAQTMIGKLFVAKEYTEAIAAGEAFISVKEDNSEVQYYISRSYAETGNAEKAVEHAANAITLAKNKPQDKYYYAHATQLEELGRKADAITEYKKIKGAKYKKQAQYKISELEG